MRWVTRTRLGIALLVAAAILGIAAIALAGGHGGGDDGPHEGTRRPAATGGAHPVAGQFKPDETLLADCPAGNQRCYEQAFGNLAYDEGPKRAIAEFDETMATNEAVRGNCHRIVHMIGSASLARFDGDVAQAFAHGSATCWSGYYHGILERAFADVSSPAEVKAVSRTICDDPDIERTTFLALPVRPRARPRPDDLLGLRPALGPRDLRRAAPRTGTRRRAPAACSWRTSRRATASRRSGCATTIRSTRARP